MTFIVIDGPDGSGTTKQSGLLAERLLIRGHRVLHTHEPTGGPIGKAIRDDLVSGKKFTSAEIQQRFCDDRAWHVEHEILPALHDSKIVVCDRYTTSTIAYGLAQGLERHELHVMNSEFPKPDVTFFLMPPFAILLDRIENRLTKDVFEEEEFQRAVYDQYAMLASEDSEIHVIDTSGKKQDTADMIYDIVEKYL